MRPWSRSWELRKHINDHIRIQKWPAKCPDPHCSHESIDEQAYRHHLHDTHRYNKTIWFTVDENKKQPSPESSEALKAESRPHVPSVKPPNVTRQSLRQQHPKSRTLSSGTRKQPKEPQLLQPVPPQQVHQKHQLFLPRRRRPSLVLDHYHLTLVFTSMAQIIHPS